MKGWEAALDRFIRPWRARKYVLGALVTGSRAFGLADRFSDIDVHIAMSNGVKWRERGNRRIDGFIVEYFANPLRMYPKYYRDGSKGGSRSIARMFAYGRILFDKDGSMGRLQKWGRRMMRKPLPRAARYFAEPAKYRMWDVSDGLSSSATRGSPGFWYAFYTGLDLVIDLYREHLGAETPAQDKMWEFLSSARFRRAHRMRPFPDRRFAAMVRGCLRVRNTGTACRLMHRLVAHAQRRMGGFDIDGWRFRSKAE